MSIDLNWPSLTTGPDGEALALKIKDFIHDRFQTIPLPRFIKSVTIHAFEFGSVPPEIEILDICDPLPDFYEENDDDESDGENDDGPSGAVQDEHWDGGERKTRRDEREHVTHPHPPPHHHGLSHIDTRLPGLRAMPEMGSPFLGASTPGIPGGTSNLSYFQSHLAPGRSGTHTPLAAVAGAQGFMAAWPDYSGRHGRSPSDESGLATGDEERVLREKHSVSTLAASSATTRPRTQDGLLEESVAGDGDGDGGAEGEAGGAEAPRRFREAGVEDLQTVSRVRYSGDVRLSLTAEILLDYPMPSFVGIPVKLNITGLSFDGVAVVAYIRKRAHFCFLSAEDAGAAVGVDSREVAEGEGSRLKMGGLLQEIKVESEIGQRENGKQVLKNVGKVEKFVLEQVRRIFEDEFVYPSFWTFLV